MTTVTPQEKYNIRWTEKKWQKKWADEQAFFTDTTSNQSKFYVLEMFPYPSGTLHMGHARNYTIGDILARYYWAQGYNVLHPMGWDACGLPAENAALLKGVHPKAWTYQNAHTMKEQCLSLGFSHDWSKEIFSCDPAYYAHEQAIFLDFYKAGLAYRKTATLNWDPVDQCVLANEQVIDGKGWRSGAVVEKKKMQQWFLRITDFAEELLQGLQGLEEWPESVRQMQINWIGKSQGAEIYWPLYKKDPQTQEFIPINKRLETFSTRPETLYGATFLGIADQHALAIQATQEHSLILEALDQWKADKVNIDALSPEDQECRRKIHTPFYGQHPFLPHIFLPVYIVNYVSHEYGTGAIFGCPAHDERDFQLEHASNDPVIFVIDPQIDSQIDSQDDGRSLVSGPYDDKQDDRPSLRCQEVSGPYTQTKGIMIHSQDLNGLTVLDARSKMLNMLEEQNKGKRKTSYRLRDWGIGRQRYWGVPIPMIHCNQCGPVPVPLKDLPVVLPEDVSFDKPGNPLERHPTWKNTSCPQCQKEATRETDTFDTFFESSWYFARYCDRNNEKAPFDKAIAESWLPVDQYVGGIEHAILHLLYARFFTKALKKCGYWNVDEPFKGLFTQGMVCHKTFQGKDGSWLYPEEVSPEKTKIADGSPVLVGRSEKMSKSKCNVVGVTPMVETYGADAVRLFLTSDTPPHKDLEWTEEGIEGSWRYVRKIWTLFSQKWPLAREWQGQPLVWPSCPPTSSTESSMALQSATQKAIQQTTEALKQRLLNKYVAYFREFGNFFSDFCPKSLDETWALREALETFVRLIAPVMPHIAQELNAFMGGEKMIHTLPWPQVDPHRLQEQQTLWSVQINGKVRGFLKAPCDASEETLTQLIRQDESLKKYTEGGSWVRMIVVPGRAVSLIISA